VQAIERLAVQRLIDGWINFAGMDDRLQRACRRLHSRGLIERTRFRGSFMGPGYSYRLAPRPATDEELDELAERLRAIVEKLNAIDDDRRLERRHAILNPAYRVGSCLMY
jgi:DNA-binding GntR family transcriptional regulator